MTDLCDVGRDREQQAMEVAFQDWFRQSDSAQVGERPGAVEAFRAGWKARNPGARSVLIAVPKAPTGCKVVSVLDSDLHGVLTEVLDLRKQVTELQGKSGEQLEECRALREALMSFSS